MGKLLERIPRDLQAKIKAMSDDDLNNFIRKANELIAFSAGYPAWLGMDLRRFARDVLAGRQALKGGEAE